MTWPPGYSEHDVEQNAIGEAIAQSSTDIRTPFQHDRDRILYSGALRNLSGKTQVVAAGETGDYHNRLTHSLRVAQLGRRMAEMLTHRLETGQTGPDPDLVETGCLAHDIGHPPFGHAGESALAGTFDDLTPSGSPSAGFQGNAQTLRILTYLGQRKKEDLRGLCLTRAGLDACMKYSWTRHAPGVAASDKKWGSYDDVDIPEERQFDRMAQKWVLLAAQPARPTDRPVETQIMDWADDVTYAVHDVEDFFRAGLIPLGSILDFRNGTPSSDAEYFLKRVEEHWNARGMVFDRDDALATLRSLDTRLRLYTPYSQQRALKALVDGMTSELLVFFLEKLELRRPQGAAYDPDSAFVRYNAELYVTPEQRRACDLLKELIWVYVIGRPGLASQQRGQARIVEELLRWVAAEPERLLPADRREELDEHGSVVRAACDHVASLTERQAVRLHRRMSGIDSGSVTDTLY